MRSLKNLSFLLAAAVPLVASHAAQGGGPASKQASPSGPPADCYQLALVEVEGIDFVYARRLVGDKWINGCIGPAGQCNIPIYIPC